MVVGSQGRIVLQNPGGISVAIPELSAISSLVAQIRFFEALKFIQVTQQGVVRLRIVLIHV